MPSPLFARHRRGDATATPTTPPNSKRAGKKRKLRQSKPNKEDEAGRIPGSVGLLQEPDLPEAHMSSVDYESGEGRVLSQDVREFIQHDVKEARLHRSPSPNIEDDYPSDATETPERVRTRRAWRKQECDTNRSRTAPASLQASSEGRQGTTDDSISGHHLNNPKLRRTHTTTEVPLDALEKLHAHLSTDADEMKTQDLAHATKLTYNVLGILNEKMSEKLESRK
ncbi:uncharacterized protein FOMMEDRAFT_132643 [Fomitiporia mediterranea MF3/22]|uniref:uncharacterized protein n=1 Tax=Fomitiporia mediterranea (strain MF3/22) TaxID=694068 RepID=UPI00044086C6|nr:uncharacterized protein FOMMEDRAFT_132643 [Fomitiporia mediterranea MF3/22]EJD04701.1 hypothetical protein FOMMEDRAFT_132643 [Fomitiporia mediterranea MF3/22]